ncbi:hypothetical protein SynBIOSU31_01406 [Synechococcus sp. BIOS-U3-1]|nr:hypothetical protein SynBIOSU31_01406 [Synechococcus sp. BIOS-U3-1]
MQQDLDSVNEIFEMIKTIELDQWYLEKQTGAPVPALESQINSAEDQAA